MASGRRGLSIEGACDYSKWLSHPKAADGISSIFSWPDAARMNFKADLAGCDCGLWEFWSLFRMALLCGPGLVT
jgi:hypothetical protein